MKRILLIEDNDIIRENTVEILVLSGYNVNTAANGVEGFNAAAKLLPDAIICDIMMPGINGIELLKKVRSSATLQKTPFIFLTARAEKTDLLEGIEYGADEYITKPFDGNELLRLLAKCLSKS